MWKIQISLSQRIRTSHKKYPGRLLQPPAGVSSMPLAWCAVSASPLAEAGASQERKGVISRSPDGPRPSRPVHWAVREAPAGAPFTLAGGGIQSRAVFGSHPFFPLLLSPFDSDFLSSGHRSARGSSLWCNGSHWKGSLTRSKRTKNLHVARCITCKGPTLPTRMP